MRHHLNHLNDYIFGSSHFNIRPHLFNANCREMWFPNKHKLQHLNLVLRFNIWSYSRLIDVRRLEERYDIIRSRYK